ncbi:MAG: hypothetical protein HYR63_12555 [Proteobacteria bacterium]|nr:hypothetical protein [Pseudomonadota bacterium]MBI3499129.1 hypothetical protein [Pseudomonadota bacterium]
MLSYHRAACLGLVAVGLLSCTGLRTINYGQPYQPTSARSFLGWAASAGPVLLEVRDNPFPVPPPVVASTIATAAFGVIPGIPARFTADPAEAGRPEWRVVYDFNVAPSTSSAQICDPNVPARRVATTDQLTALVVFCNETRPIIAAGAWSAPIPGSESPLFRQFARHSMATLFEPQFNGNGHDIPEFPAD